MNELYENRYILGFCFIITMFALVFIGFGVLNYIRFQQAVREIQKYNRYTESKNDIARKQLEKELKDRE